MRKSYNYNSGGLRSFAAVIVGLNMALSSQGETSTTPIGFANAASISSDNVMSPQSTSLLQIENQAE